MTYELDRPEEEMANVEREDLPPDITPLIPGLSNGEFILQDLTVINNDDGYQWPNFPAYGKYMGPAGAPAPTLRFGSTHQWHHIVEKNQEQFDSTRLNSSNNLFRVPSAVHAIVTDYYAARDRRNAKNQNDPKLIIRKWLKEEHHNDWDFQYEFGMNLLKEVGKPYGWTPKTQDIR